ncbi:hypothetical protein L207DRAFT_511881 [Hyaloscypha variabilis F]|uniref:Uncharacterized protein n=1 Tax=Hyaloscypha variabilis (strain UAMH 11265 / GT02V1 / F) TaxID=1149755 RepID=A0A2J6RPE3_HYAVF|nr:hypothetical protein L207DRAFT_511881 [Hyaloscypha variabilis F]
MSDLDSRTCDSMVGAYPQDKPGTETDGMEWESSSELHQLGAEVGGVKIGRSDKEIKQTPAEESRHLDDQFEHTEKAEVSRADPAFLSDQPLPSSTDTEHKSKASQPKQELIESLINTEARLKTTTVNDDRSRTSISEFELNSTLEEACETARKFKETQREHDILQRQVLELQKELRDAHDFIFSLQPRREQITESEAAAEFRSLGRTIEDWVETNLGDDIHDRSILKRPHASQIRRFLTFVSLPGKEASRRPDTDVYNVMAAIMKFLCSEIFDKDFYCPIEEGAMDFLNSILMSMRKLEPRRDLSTWRRWRSETLTALAGRREFASQRQRLINHLVSELTSMLLIFLPRSDIHKLAPSVYDAIIEPALLLAHKLQLSLDKFSLSWTHFAGTKLEERSIDPRDYNSFECVDILRSGKVMKSQAVAASGNITYMFDLTPALIYEAVKADAFADPRVLNRGRILVAATKEGDGQFVYPRKDSEEPTLVAWLFEKMRKHYSSHK